MSYILSVSQLKTNIMSAENQNLISNFEDLSAGEKHLYESLYLPLLTGKDIYIRDIDFDSFDSEDIQSFYHFFSQKLSESLNKIGNLCDCITGSAAKSTPVAFI